MDRLRLGPDRLPLFEHLEEAALAFRLGAEGEGSERLLAMIEEVVPALNAFPPALVLEANQILAEILATQGSRDFIYLADLLEYRFAPFISRAGR